MEIEDRIARGNREIEWDPETESTVAVMIRRVRTESRPRWSTGRKLLLLIPAAAILGGSLTAGGVSIANSLTKTPDAIVEVHYRAADGSAVSCEVVVTASGSAAKQFIREHDWSDISQKARDASAAGAEARSVIDLIYDEIPARVFPDETSVGFPDESLVNFATSC